MGDKTNRYPLLVQWDQGPEKLKDLKNKLLKYFHSQRQSNGGECEIPDTDCSQGYITIYFKDKEAPQRVVQKNPHEVVLDKTTTLSLWVSLPNAESSQRMGNSLSSLAASSEDKASGYSGDTDHQKKDDQSADIRKRESSLMTDSDFKNGDPKRPHLKRPDDSTRHTESEKDTRAVGAPEEEEQDHNSSSQRSSTGNEDKSPEDSAISRNESGRSKEENRHPATPAEDDQTSGSSVDKDYQQENNRSSDFQNRENSSLTNSGSMDGDRKRSEDGSTRHTERGEYRSDGGNHRNEQDTNSSASKTLRVNGERSPEYDFTLGKNSSKGLISNEELARNRTAPPPEIFKNVTARLDKEWFTEALQKEIKREYKSLIINDQSNVVEVTGKYGEIDSLYRYLQGGSKQEHGAEKPPDTPSDWSPADSQTDQVCFPSALYEYIMEIYKTEIDKLERRYGVKIVHRSAQEGSTYVRFISQGSESSPEKAKEKFTDKVQKVMGDWSQETVDSSVVPLTFSDIKERVTNRWSNTQVIQGDNMGIILRGPKDELSQVKTFLEKDDHKPADHKPARPRRDVTISTSNMGTDIPVDVRHMDILRKLKHREISDIEKKYNVKMEEKKKNVSSLVTFRSVNAPPDLSPHASHSFITLLQKTFFNIERKEISVKPELQEGDLAILQEQLMMSGIDLVMEYSKGSVLLIGHPVHVAFAEEKLNGSRNPGRGQAAAASAKKTDTDSPPTATQKAEEPDTCPICQCEIEDKVILEKCKHAYCKDCLKQATAHKPVCAICGDPYGTVIGDQPDGTMTVNTNKYLSLPGYSGYGTIQIHYDIPSGIQKENHPHPGRHFSGTSRTAYLPDNQEGNEILRLLRKAFDQKLIFTVGESRTTRATDTVTWNDIHHKTNTHEGAQNFGYPDPNYLARVRDELKAKGVE